MDSTLNALFEGKLYPSEGLVPKEPEYHDALRKMDEIADTLRKMVGEEGLYPIEKYEALCDMTTYHRARTCFAGGFSLGARLLSAAYEKDLPNEVSMGK